MVKAILERIFVHWKTTATGTAVTAAVLAALVQNYQAGMTWKLWLIGAIPAVIGVLLKDPTSAASRVL